MTFNDLGLIEPILRAVAAEGYTVPTPIQVKAIPHVLAGSDLLGCAQTGTGKTAAFAWPILQKLSEGQTTGHKSHAAHGHSNGHAAHTNGHAAHKPSPHAHSPRHAPAHIRALILCPTRELASQIADSFRSYGKHLHLKHTVVFGGVNQHHQVKALKAGVDILIATPGRLLDLMNQGYIDLRAVEVFVLDEADRMLDMGFIPDIRKIVKRIPEKRQTLFFSATMPSDIRHLADSLLNKPVSVTVTPVASTVDSIAQSVYYVQRKMKTALLTHLLKNTGMGRTLVFTRTKHGADKVVKTLTNAGIKAEAIHGNKSQNARTRALASFKGQKPPVLVATDIASRGIDVDEITHVINFDIPNVAETYVHRIGRTARAGASGTAISFCDPGEERGDLRAIEKLIRKPIEVCTEQHKLVALPMPAYVEDRDERRPHSYSHAGSKPRTHSNSSGGGFRGERSGAPNSDRDSRRRGQPQSNRNTSSGGGHTAHPKHQSKREGAARPQLTAGPGPQPKKRSFQSKGRGPGRGPGKSGSR